MKIASCPQSPRAAGHYDLPGAFYPLGKFSLNSDRRVWDLGRRQLSLVNRPLVMGILNVTPDSFSDGGKYDRPEQAVDMALQMQADGADIIDIGGESTRPYSVAVSAQDERLRVMPVINQLSGKLSIPISIDTSKSLVAQAAIDGGAEIVNDVTGLEGDPEMPALVCAAGVGICVMHMRGTPQTMQEDPHYENVVEQIYDYLIQRRDFCINLGIPPNKICLDPGIGFGKTHEHNLELIRSTKRFTQLGSPLLIGHSRKGFIAKLLGDQAADRTAATLGVSMALAAAGADILRVHDVKQTVEALRLFKAAGGF